MRPPAIFLAALGCAFLTGCGSIGEPLYPALNIPTHVSDLAAVERGNRIEVTFTIPPLTTEGLVVKTIGSVELRTGPNTGPGFDIDRWAAGAVRADVAPPSGTGPMRVQIPAQQFVGQEVVVAVRVANTKGRYSAWSNVVTLAVEPPLATPVNLKAEPVAQGVAVTWSDTDARQFRVYRRTGDQKEPAVLATAGQPNYTDTTTEYGKTYEYSVEALRDKALSEMAGPVSVTPKDVFPPAVPSGVNALAGTNSIELAWERNTEPDFLEYRVQRAEGAGAFSQIAAGLQAPAYSDRGVESGKRYRYRIVAVDQSGNASQPSNPVEITVP